MDISKPFAAISPGVDGDVLVTLAGSTQPRTGREIARLAERSKTGVQAVLDRLVEHGLVDRQEAGEAFLYTLNREHLLSPVVEQMAAARSELFQRLRETVGSWEKPPVHASLFGSAARGDGDVSSDIDLFVVRPADLDPEDAIWRRQIDDLAETVQGWTGNHPGISEVSVDEIPRLVRDQPPVINDLQEDVVELAGKELQKLLAGP
jgi:predicted transcriptional regulator